MLVALWLVAAPVLAAVLGVAGVAKLRSPLETDRSFRDLRVHPRLARPWIRRLLPWGEVALAVALLAAWGWAAPIVTALVLTLLLAYLVVIARAVARPEPVICNCFGGAGTRPVDGWTIARNVAFVVIAATALVAVVAAPEARSAAWPLLLVDTFGGH